jgi:hypothetical protein
MEIHRNFETAIGSGTTIGCCAGEHRIKPMVEVKTVKRQNNSGVAQSNGGRGGKVWFGQI